MKCTVCKIKDAKLPGSTCGLKCATKAYPRGDKYEAIDERYKAAIAESRLNNGFSVGHGGKF